MSQDLIKLANDVDAAAVQFEAVRMMALFVAPMAISAISIVLGFLLAGQKR